MLGSSYGATFKFQGERLFADQSPRINLRLEFAGLEGAESAEAIAEFGRVEAAIAEEPAEEVFGGTGAFLSVARFAGGYEITIGISSECGARHDMVQASPARYHPPEAVKASSRFSFVN